VIDMLAFGPGHPPRVRGERDLRPVLAAGRSGAPESTGRTKGWFVLRFKGILLVAGFVLPAVAVRAGGLRPPAAVALAIFGAAVVAASFLLAWAAEAAQLDISGGLAIALLALIAVLPEYAVDLYFAFTAGHDPTYTGYATANMTGSNRLLMGLGWPLVVLLGLMVTRRGGNAGGRARGYPGRGGRGRGYPARVLPLAPGIRVELGFLLVAGVVAFVAPVTASISMPLALVLLGWFGCYLYRVSRQAATAPHLIGTAAALGELPARVRRPVVVAMFAGAAVVVLLCAEPFAHSLIATGGQLGIDEFLLVQWLAPLASEAPEFIVAILFATRGNAQDAIGTLISSKVNQWTLLVGSLPVAYWLGGGGAAGLPLDGRQVEELLLTATQTVLGVAVLLTLRFPGWGAWTLLGLFAVQFAVTGTTGRLLLCAGYGLIALALLIRHRRQLIPTLRAPFLAPAAGSPRPVALSRR
jgi:cation:H+ antiporter